MMSEKGYTKVFNWDVKSGSFALKHIIGGMFIAIAMTGLDQEMMQKNISVKNLKDSQKNMMTFTTVLMIVNFLFLMLGGVLYLYAGAQGINVPPDDLFPTIALSKAFSGTIGIIFIIALISALFPSVDEDEGKNYKGGGIKRYAHFIKNEYLQYTNNQVKPCSGSNCS